MKLPHVKTDSGGARVQRFAEQLDRVQLANAEAARGIASGSPGASSVGRLDPRLRERLGISTASSVERGAGADSLIALKEANSDYAAGQIDKQTLELKLHQLTTSDFSPAAQAAFIAYLEGRGLSPAQLGDVADKLRQTWPPGTDVGPLHRFFRSSGVRLTARDTIPEAAESHAIDIRGFSREVRDLERSGGEIDRRAARRLFAYLGHVEDRRELSWAEWKIRGKLENGKLRFASRADEQRLLSMLDQRLGGLVNEKEIVRAMGDLRRDDFSEPAIARMTELVERCGKNTRSLFAAERHFHRHADKAISAARESDPAKAARLESVKARIGAMFDARTEGLLDHFTTRRMIMERLGKGEISRAEAGGLLASAAMSETTEEFARSSMRMYSRLRLAQGFQQVQDAWNDLMRTFAQAMSGDEYDAHGRLIQTASERDLKRRLAERLLERLRLSAEQSEELAKRAVLKSGRTAVKAQINLAHGPSELAAAHGKEAALEAADLDLDRAAPAV